MRVGVSIKPVAHLVQDIQEFLEALFADVEDLRDVEVHTNDLDDFTIFLLKIAEELKIRYSIHCPHMYSQQPVNLCSAKKEDKKIADVWLTKSIAYARKLDARYIIIHPDVPRGCSKKEALIIFEKHIHKHLPELSKRQLLLIENMPGADYTLSTPEEFASFLPRFKKRVGICWDVGHEIVRFRKQEFLFPQLLGKHIKEVHISGVKQNIEGVGDHFSLTDGNLELEICIAELKKARFRGAIIFEIVTHNPLDIIASKNKIDAVIKENN